MQRFAAFVLMLITLVMIGCDDPAHRERIARREENLRHTGQTLVEMESERPAQLRRTLADLERQHRDDILQSAENPGRIGRWVEQDFDRWNERQPAYRRGIHDELKGDPENIKRTIPDILY